MSDTPTIPPAADPVLAAFEALSGKMDRFNATMTACHDILIELRDWRVQVDDRLSALESIPPHPSNGTCAP